MTFLALDIGNTRLKWAQYDAPHAQAQLLGYGAEFLDNIDNLAERVWHQLPPPSVVLGCAVASDAVKRQVQEQIDFWDATPQWVVSSASEADLHNSYDHPARLGPDRWVAMIGAYHHVRAQGHPRPMVVVMVGTAVTVDAVDAQGRFLGGYILPGHGIMLRALQSNTAGLHVPTGTVHAFPTNTSDALTSGGTYAIVGAVQRMLEHLQARCGTPAHCIMSGGAAWKIAPSMSAPFELIDTLIFDGLRHIAQRRLAVD